MDNNKINITVKKCTFFGFFEKKKNIINETNASTLNIEKEE